MEKKDSSQDEMIETELAMIRKQNLKKYVMVNKQFKSTLNESEEESYKKQNKMAFTEANKKNNKDNNNDIDNDKSQDQNNPKNNQFSYVLNSTNPKNKSTSRRNY